MRTFIDWVSHHVLTTMLVAGTAYAVFYVISRRKELFYRN
jgi:hypothetical protein